MSRLRLLLVADTHLPAGDRIRYSTPIGERRSTSRRQPSRRVLPEPVWAGVDEADVVVHAGDWMAPDLLDALEQRSRRLVACYGNNDGHELRARLPEVGRVELDGLRLAVVHETGDARGREIRCDAAYADDTDVLVFGHSHIPWDTTTPRGLRLLNPGSPTERRRQPACTYMTAEVDDGALISVVRHDLPVTQR